MELTPKVFRDVQFREKLRGGYHPEDVDEFLEQAALGAEALIEQLRQATERAQRAERAASDAGNTDETLKRMLLMAQRTADQAVKEARDDAERMLVEAHAKADAILADADARGKASYEAALDERRAAMESAEAALEQAQREVQGLQDWVGTHRGHLVGIMRESQSLIENAGLLSDPPPVTPLAQSWSAKPAEGSAGEPEGQLAGHGDGDTGRWDPHYLDNLADEHGEETQPGHGQAGPGPVAGGWQEGPAGGELPGEPEVSGAHQAGPFGGPFSQDQQLGQTAVGNPSESFGHVPPAYLADPGEPTGDQPAIDPGQGGDNPMAFNERALDNFFSGQDLGDDRSLGRFRRRQ